LKKEGKNRGPTPRKKKKGPRGHRLLQLFYFFLWRGRGGGGKKGLPTLSAEGEGENARAHAPTKAVFRGKGGGGGRGGKPGCPQGGGEEEKKEAGKGPSSVPTTRTEQFGDRGGKNRDPESLTRSGGEGARRRGGGTSVPTSAPKKRGKKLYAAQKARSRRTTTSRHPFLCRVQQGKGCRGRHGKKGPCDGAQQGLFALPKEERMLAAAKKKKKKSDAGKRQQGTTSAPREPLLGKEKKSPRRVRGTWPKGDVCDLNAAREL